MSPAHHRNSALLLGLATLALASVAAEPVHAQESVEGGEIAIEAVIGRLVEVSPRLARSRISVERARLGTDAEGAALTPQLTFDTSYLHSDEPTQSLFEDGLRITDVVRLSASVAKRLRWGTDVSLAWESSRLQSVQPFTLPGGGRQVSEIGPNWDEGLTLTLRQPLLKGFGSELNTVNVELAERQMELAELELEQSASTEVLGVLQIYLEWFYASDDVSIKNRALEFLAEQREATQALIAAGTVAEIEIDVLEQRALAIEEARLVSEHQRDLQRLDLLERLMGEDQPSLTRGAPGELPELGALSDEDAVVERALARSTSLAVLREQRALVQARLIGTEDAVKPQLDLTMRVGQRGLSDGFIDATGQVVTLNAGNFFIGLSLAMPLDNTRAEAQNDAQRLELSEVDADLQDATSKLTTNVRKAYRLVDLNRRRLALAQRTVALAKKTRAAEQEKFKGGRSTNQAVLQFQEELEQSEVRVLRARIDLRLSILQLHHLSGTLLSQLGVEVR